MTGTDLDWLHKDKDPDVRANGKTFDDCHTVVGVVGLGEKTIICKVSCYSRLSFIQPMLLFVLEEMGYKPQVVTHRAIECENSVIRFISKSSPLHLESYHSCAVVDFID